MKIKKLIRELVLPAFWLIFFIIFSGNNENTSSKIRSKKTTGAQQIKNIKNNRADEKLAENIQR